MRQFVFSVRTLIAAGALFAILGAASADSQEFTGLRPLRTVTGIRAVRESSAKWVPQIQPAYNFGGPSPSNPRPFVHTIEAENSLPVGGLLPTPRTTVEAMFGGITATGWTPPDPNIAVGPNHIVEVVNSSIAWFDKNGLRQFEVSMGPIDGPAEGFFESLGPGNFVFDPKCFYDAISGRFFVVALEADFAGGVSKLLVAVSDDNNPNGIWFKYRLEAKLTISGNETWLDYPGFGCNKDALVITGNQFGFSSGFFGVQVIVIPKAPLLIGGTASETQTVISDAATVQVARMTDATLSQLYMVGQAGSTSSIRLYAITGLPSSPVIASKLVTVPTWFFPSSEAISTNGHSLDSLDGRIVDANYRAGRIAAIHTTQVNSTDSRCNMRWYEFATNNWPISINNPTLVQSGNVNGLAGQHYNMGGIGINGVGDIAITFTRSSTGIVADHMIAGRASTDPLGTMGLPVLVQSSAGASYGGVGSNRWGDYFSVEIDPADNLSFWSVGMIGRSDGNWTTIINKHLITQILPGTNVDVPPSTVAIYVDPISIPAQQGNNLTGPVSNAALSDDLFVNVDTVVSKIGDIAAAEYSFATAFNGTIQSLKMRIETNGPVNTTGMLWVYSWNAAHYVQVKAFPLSPTSNTIVEIVLSAPFSAWIGPGGQIKAVLRALAPIRIGALSVPFTFKMDLVQVRARILE